MTTHRGWKEWKGKDPIWCPGCGDFGVLTAMQKAAANLDLDPQTTVLVTGIGCSGNITAYFQSFGFHGIHGRALPVATGIKLANPELTVLVAGGDGDGFGIGLSHFLHAARRNVDLTYVVMDNQVYGLTKGQTSPTTPGTMTTKASPLGPMAQPLNPLALALSAGASFVAQAYSGDQTQLIGLLEAGIRHKGFSFLNTQSPCVTYNLVNTYDWFRANVRKLDGTASPGQTLDASKGTPGIAPSTSVPGTGPAPNPPRHDPSDWDGAMAIANNRAVVPTGLLYQAHRATLGEAVRIAVPDADALPPIEAAGDPGKAHDASKGRFGDWLAEFKVR